MTRKKIRIQFFCHMSDDILRDCANKLEKVGYRVQFAPSSGPPAIWFGHCEVIGRNAIMDFVEDLCNEEGYYKCGCGELVPDDEFCIDCDLARDIFEDE